MGSNPAGDRREPALIGPRVSARATLALAAAGRIHQAARDRRRLAKLLLAGSVQIASAAIVAAFLLAPASPIGRRAGTAVLGAAAGLGIGAFVGAPFTAAAAAAAAFTAIVAETTPVANEPAAQKTPVGPMGRVSAPNIQSVPDGGAAASMTGATTATGNP